MIVDVEKREHVDSCNRKQCLRVLILKCDFCKEVFKRNFNSKANNSKIHFCCKAHSAKYLSKNKGIVKRRSETLRSKTKEETDKIVIKRNETVEKRHGKDKKSIRERQSAGAKRFLNGLSESEYIQHFKPKIKGRKRYAQEKEYERIKKWNVSMLKRDRKEINKKISDSQKKSWELLDTDKKNERINHCINIGINAMVGKTEQEKEEIYKKISLSCNIFLENTTKEDRSRLFGAPSIAAKNKKSEEDDNYWKKISEKTHNTKIKNGTYGSSRAEDEFYDSLCSFFKENGPLERQHPINGWLIDFKYMVKEAYIRFNGDYFHGRNYTCAQLLEKAEKIEAKTGKKSQYRTIAETKIRDQEKDKWFKDSGLKLITVWEMDFKNDKEGVLKMLMEELNG